MPGYSSFGRRRPALSTLDHFGRSPHDETDPTSDNSAVVSVLPIDLYPPPAERRPAHEFLQTWNRLPSHMRQIVFDLHGLGWTRADITKSVNVLAGFP